MFKQLIAIEPISINSYWREELKKYADEVIFYEDLPQNNCEILQRIGKADGILVNFTTQIDREVLEAAPELKYVGMCCSLYSPDSANVDILTANRLGITVKGVLDYGDEGVPEYVVSELVRLLHGFGPKMWREQPTELTGHRVGIIGLGTTGSLLAETLQFFGADIAYFSRTRKKELEQAKGYHYLSLPELLEYSEILITCLNKNTILLHENEFTLFGDGKILVNTSIGPSHELIALENWLKFPSNFALSDTPAGIDPTGALCKKENVFCGNKPAGRSDQSANRLGQKVVKNIIDFLND